jgi:hypothetical protein
MARVREHGNGKLEEALATLLQTQAIFVQNQAEFAAQKVESDKRIARMEKDFADFRRETAERFERIEAILIEHNRILKALPDMLREKIGFKVPETAPSEK